MKKIRTKDFIFTVLIILTLYYITDTNITWYLDAEEVRKDHSSAIGWMVDYREIGTSMTPTITYRYFAGGEKWKIRERTFSPNVDFSECIKDFKKCEGSFWFSILKP